MIRFQPVLPLLLGALLASTSVPAEDNAFGPERWRQYRLNAANNAVYDNGAAPLPRMTFRTGDQVRATPVVVGDALYIGNHATGGLFRFDLPSGKVAWDDDHPWFRHAPNWIHSDMIQSDGRIFVGYGNRAFQSAEVRGTGESGVMAVDPKTGETLWEVPFGQVQKWGFYMPESWGSPTIGGPVVTASGLIFIGASMDARVRALDASNGEVLWKAQVEAPAVSIPAVYDYEGRQYVVFAVGGNSIIKPQVGDQLIAFALPED